MSSHDAAGGFRFRPQIRHLVLAAFGSVLIGFVLGRFLPGWRGGGSQADKTAPPPAAQTAPPIELLPEPEAPPPATAQIVIDEANRAVEHLRQSYPDTADALEIQARVQQWLGNSDEAVRIWNECLKLDPKYVYALVGLASVASKKGDYAQAAEHAARAIELAPGNFQARVLRAEALIRLRRAAEAIPVLEEFLKTDPRSQGFFRLGQAYFEMQQFDKARENYEAAVKKYPDYAEAYHGLSQALTRLGQPDQAKQAMDKFRQFAAPEKAAERVRGVAVSDLQSTCTEAATLYTDAGRIYFLRGRSPEAERLWRRAALLDRKAVDCRQSLAWLCRQHGRAREAVEWLEQLAALDARPARYWLEIGLLRGELIEYPAAEKALRTAIQLAPQDAEAHAALASLLVRTGRNLAEAPRLAQTAVRLSPTAAHYGLLAAACRRAGDEAGARAAAEQAAKLAPNPK